MVLAAVLALLFSWGALVALYVSHAKERQALLAAFALERKAWVNERRDLNNRIQIPEAAPYMAEDEPGADVNDLPTLPEFTVDEEEMERAQRELEQVGYTDGPAA